MSDAWIGALLALCGVLVAQLVAMLQARLERDHQRNILLISKYEELTDHVNDSLSWANDSLRATTFAELHSNNQPLHARRAYALALLYFPRLLPATNAYVEASVAFHNTLVETFSELGGVTAGAQAAKHSLQAFENVGESLRMARELLDADIQKYAATYVKA